MALEKVWSLQFTSLMLIVGLAAMSTLSGCNTVSGFGRDVEAAGDSLENSAEDAKN